MTKHWVPTKKEQAQRRMDRLVRDAGTTKDKQEKLEKQKAQPRKSKDKLNNRRR